jgi:hypothetical protein
VSKHTPGPWTFVDDEIIAGDVHVVCFGHDYDDYGCIGARFTCDDPWRNKACSDAHDAEVKANVRLIAAAPDLAAVLQKVAEHFKDTDAPLGEMAREALKKAGL